ncbi:DUF4097 family beta strand repeat-containing protein [Belliella kenyensis]|uniref:DUF4097 family beta strand repeat-containing protein n=1 Tax=Belliella kenyensis TaxID=1472724 RepID=A0ABV8EM32_9BACT|nr:DUF4097 family beta strand repeat-containing protein [Belliella kenyensis]MCH7403620.1 hypothetical protein [Belliella kenyensis]MDN3603828.1 hypothetical protein [Belliella kenyensis]
MKTALNTIIACLCLFTSLEVSAQREILIDTQRTFQGVETIEIRSGGLEIVYAGDASIATVTADAYLESNQTKQDIVFVQVGNVLKITYKNEQSNVTWGNNQTKGHVKIKGPEQINLVVQGGSGKIDVTNVSSNITHFQIGSGRANLSRIKGDVELSMGSGTVDLKQVNGDVNFRGGSGRAEIAEVSGDLNVSFSSGSFQADQVAGNVSLQLSSGNAKLSKIGSIENVSVSSGSFKAEQAGLGENPNLKAGSGSIKINTNSNIEDYNFNMKAASGSIKVGDQRTGKSLLINNGSCKTVNGSVSSGSIAIEN